MASSPITSRQIEREKVKVTDFIVLGSTVTADGDCSHEIKTLAPWKESCDKPEKESESVNCSAVFNSATPCAVACQAPLSMGFSRQEYWNG